MTADLLRKTLAFVNVGAPYWRRNPAPATDGSTPPPYPLDFVSHIVAGHYRARDDRGLPMSGARSRGTVHNYTRLCGYALGHLQAFEATGREEHLSQAMLVGSYLRDTAVSGPDGLLLRAEVPGMGHVGPISAMSQGMAISVLTRLDAYTGQTDDGLAAALARPFRIEAGEFGVRAVICPDGCVWFEEDVAEPLRHILNGMIFAVWGLSDLARLGAVSAREDYLAGIASLCRHVTDFDAGWWSYYDTSASQPARLASAHYHLLHVCQLSALGDDGYPELERAAQRFTKQLRSPASRLRAAASVAVLHR